MTNLKIILNTIKGPDFKNDVSSLIGYIKTKDLIGNTEVPYAGRADKEGYQRQPQIARIRKLATKILKNDVDLPTLVLLNIRNIEATKSIKENSFEYLPPVHGPMSIMDGQHRILALKSAMEMAEDQKDNEALERISEKLIPFGLTITRDILHEMEIFSDVNGNAKAVAYNVKKLINQRRYQLGDQSIEDELKLSGQEWELLAGQIIEDMSGRINGVWHKRIKFPGDTGILSPNVGNAAFQKYLKPVVKSNQAKMSTKPFVFSKSVVNAYWDGFELACPEVFGANASKYSIQTAMGTDVFMRLWDFMKDWIASNNKDNNKDLTKPETYRDAIKKVIANSDGYNASGQNVTGTDFWLKGKDGAAGGYSSESGKSVLLNNLTQWLVEE